MSDFYSYLRNSMKASASSSKGLASVVDSLERIRSFDESSQAGRYEWIVNEPETADDKSPIGSSWKAYWEHDGKVNGPVMNRWPKQCSVAGCTRDAEHGAHVRDKDGKVFIIPMCAKDNNPHNKDDMRVKKNTKMVEAPK